jgi:TusA-related sulfurtransferase
VLDENAEIPYDCYGEAVADEGEGEKLAACPVADDGNVEPASTVTLDACGLQCPGPIMKLAEGIKSINNGDRLIVKATDPGFASDVGVWCERTGNRLENMDQAAGVITVSIRKGGVHAPHDHKTSVVANDKSIVVFMEILTISRALSLPRCCFNGSKVTLSLPSGFEYLRREKWYQLKRNLLRKCLAV